MNAPLSLFLTQFSAPPSPVTIVEEPAPKSKPGVWMTIGDLESQLDTTAERAKAEAEQRHEAEIAALKTAHQEAMAQALASARAEWIETEQTAFASSFEAATTELRNVLTQRIAKVLRPLMAGAILARTKTELLDVLDRLLADQNEPTIRVRASEDLGAALRAARPDAGIEWIVGDSTEVTIIADATRIETKLAAALADIAATEI